MNTTTHYFREYRVYYMCGGSAALGVPQEAEIDCFDGADECQRHVGTIYFHPNTTRLPANTITEDAIYLHFGLNRFQDVMTTLKENRDDMCLSLDETSKVGYIGHSYGDPIGMQEET